MYNDKYLINKYSFFLILITIISFILRFYKLEYQSLWLDELYSINFSSSKNSINEVFNYLKNDGAHPSLYYLIIHSIFRIFGDSGYILRLFSCIIGTLIVPAGYFLGKNILNKRLAVIFSIIIAFNPYLIKYSQEGRMYILFVFTIILCFIYFFKYIKSNEKINLYLFIITICLMINTHFYGYFIASSLLSIVLLDKYSIIKLKEYLSCFFLLILSNVLNIIILFNSVQKKSFWITRPTSNFLFEYLNDFTFNNYFILIFSCFLIFFCFCKTKKIEQYIYYICITIFLLVSLPLIISYFKLPMIISRHFISGYILILLLTSIGISSTNKKYQKLILISYIFLSFFPFIYSTRYYFSKEKEDFNAVANYILINNDKNFVFMKKEMFNYYLSKNRIINDSVTGLKLKKNNVYYFIERDGISEIRKKELKTIKIIDTIKFNKINLIHLKKVL